MASTALLVAVAACNKPAEQPQQAAAPPGPAPGTPEWKISSAMSAAPTSIASGATIMDMDTAGHMTQLRAGTNGWTCLPDAPQSPAPDPVCYDAQWGKWFEAWMGHKTPAITAVGVAYMLAGSSDPSNTDAFATKPDSGKGWLNGGPHLMLVTPGPHAYDAISGEWNNNSTPYIMFKGTPYAHVMVPVGAHATN